MIRNILRLHSCKSCKKLLTESMQVNTIKRFCSYLDQFDPPYLEDLKPKIPEYEAVNVQMKAFDFVILENYQGFVHRIAKAMEIEVEDGWAIPASVTHIKKFKPNTSNVECEYTLHTYERNIQVVDVSSPQISIFLELIQSALPQGVNLTVHEHLPEHEELRYVPDYELKELKAQLELASQKKK